MSIWNQCVSFCGQRSEFHDQKDDCTRHQLHLAYGGMFLFVVGFGIAIWCIFTYVFIEPQGVFPS